MRSIVNRLFYAVGGVLIVIGNVRPDVENVGFRERRQNVGDHRLAARQSSFSA